MNPDVLVHEQAIDIMISTLHNSEGNAVVGPKIINIDGSIANFINTSLTYKDFLKEKQSIKKIIEFFEKEKKEKEILPNTCSKINGMVSGCCFAIKGNIFKNIKYFDDNVFLYCEETILWEKLQKLNKNNKVIYEPLAEIEHRESTAIGGWVKPFSRRCYAISLLYYQCQYRNLKGFKLLFAKLITKIDYILISWKLHQDYKSEYVKLKKQLKDF